MKTYTPKNLYEVYTNDKQHIIVKSTPETLEKLVMNDLIREWNTLKIYKY